jgi:lipoprotein-anchoring transpeptidase ErfK/SrfK
MEFGGSGRSRAKAVIMRLVRPASPVVVALGAVVAVLGATGAVLAATHVAPFDTSASRGAPAQPSLADAVPPVVTVLGLTNGRVPWNKPLEVEVTNGVIRSVAVTTGEGLAIDGVIGAGSTVWKSAKTLVPLSRYTATVVYVDDAKHVGTTTMSFSAADASKHLRVELSPGDGAVVGVGSPVIVQFSRPIPLSRRAVVEARLSVTTTPVRTGAWHWMNSQEVHWRPPTYWTKGARVRVAANLDGLYLGDGVWGSGHHETSFRIGDAHVSRVDVAAHKMYVYNNGILVKTFPISAGRDKYPTKNGVHITFEKSQLVIMDSATVGIPRNSPDGYYEKVYWDVRISYGGAFVHAAPWSVRDQGITNVSHGCVNLSPANAQWFYAWSYRGDIVDVLNSSAAPDLSDPGMADWNYTWSQWLAGDAAPSPAALALHPGLPRDSEPGVSGSTSGAGTTTRSPSPSPSPKPTTSPTPVALPTKPGQ